MRRREGAARRRAAGDAIKALQAIEDRQRAWARELFKLAARDEQAEVEPAFLAAALTA